VHNPNELCKGEQKFGCVGFAFFDTKTKILNLLYLQCVSSCSAGELCFPILLEVLFEIDRFSNKLLVQWFSKLAESPLGVFFEEQGWRTKGAKRSTTNRSMS